MRGLVGICDHETDFVTFAFFAMAYFLTLLVTFLLVGVLSKAALLEILVQSVQIGVDLERQSLVQRAIVRQQSGNVGNASAKNDPGFWRPLEELTETQLPIIRVDGKRCRSVDLI